MTQPCNYWTLIQANVGRDTSYRKLNLYRCICGNEKILVEDNVKSNKSKSCGCMKGHLVSIQKIEHGNAIRGKLSPAYLSYRSMKARCLDKNHPYYYNYGGRGVTICETWLTSFESFLNDMGNRPTGCTLDRINSNGNYCKENCKWSTYKEQANNRRNSIEYY